MSLCCNCCCQFKKRKGGYHRYSLERCLESSGLPARVHLAEITGAPFTPEKKALKFLCPDCWSKLNESVRYRNAIDSLFNSTKETSYIAKKRHGDVEQPSTSFIKGQSFTSTPVKVQTDTRTMALPADLLRHKDSPVYQPVLRSILKSQIQHLVEQLQETGEETLILTANIKNQDVSELGTESGRQFVDMYDDFKSEFLGFCQRRDRKRKAETSPHVNVAKKDKIYNTPVITSYAKSSKVQSPSSSISSPKVSAARVVAGIRQKDGKSVSTPGSSTKSTTKQTVVYIQQQGGEKELVLEGTTEELGVLGMAGSELVGYEHMDEEAEVDDDWDPNTSEHEQGTTTTTTTTPRTTITTKTVEKSDADKTSDAKTQADDIPVNFQRMFDKATSCPECGKLFIRADALNLHMLSHTGEYPFQCNQCGAQFRKKRSMVQHMLKKHGESV